MKTIIKLYCSWGTNKKTNKQIKGKVTAKKRTNELKLSERVNWKVQDDVEQKPFRGVKIALKCLWVQIKIRLKTVFQERN